MSTYRSKAAPITLEDTIDIVQSVQEFLQRETTAQGGREGDNPTVTAADRQVHLSKPGSGQKTTVKVPKAGDLLALIGSVVRPNEVYKMLTEFVPTRRNDAILFASNGRELIELARSGAVGQLFGCPVIINEAGVACNPVLRVEGDTEQNLIYVQGPNNQVGIGMIPTVANNKRLQVNNGVGGGISIGAAHITNADFAIDFSSNVFGMHVAGDLGPDPMMAIRFSDETIHFFGIPAGTQDFNVGASMDFQNRIIFKRTATAINHVVASDDYYIGVTDTSAVRTITLPVASSGDGGNGRTVIVKDESGGAGTNAILIVRSGSDTVDGGTQVSIGNNFGSRTFITNGTTAWFSH